MKTRYVELFAFTLASVAVLASAHAADMDVPGPSGDKGGPSYPSWAWFYIGVNAGGAWSEFNDKYALPGIEGELSPSGGFGGGQIGFNWQSSHFVYGVE